MNRDKTSGALPPNPDPLLKKRGKTLTLEPQVVIGTGDANRRLDKYLFAYMNNAPHSFIYKMLRKKRIKLNGKKAAGSEILQAGDEIRFFLSEETLQTCRKQKTAAPAKPLTGIIYEDENILVVNKPAGLPSQGGMKGKTRDHLQARILHYLKTNETFTPAICNRLDVNTSGLVICGKTLHALQEINQKFANREIKKEYLAIVHGKPGLPGHTRTLRGYYEKDEKTNTARVDVLTKSGTTSKEILTEFTVLQSSAKYSLLSVSPITGRSHQIRVHLASINHPILGDTKYGGSPLPPTSNFRGQLLHCHRLSFTANNGKPMQFTAENLEISNFLLK
jgi:23S rRNA pseudouridine955/2504/2580 synthase